MSDLVMPAGLYLGANLADLGSTEYAREFGAGEANKLGQAYGGRLAVKGGLVLVQVGADLYLQHLEKRTRLEPTIYGTLERRKTTTAKAASVLKWLARGGVLAFYLHKSAKNIEVANDMRRIDGGVR